MQGSIGSVWTVTTYTLEALFTANYKGIVRAPLPLSPTDGNNSFPYTWYARLPSDSVLFVILYPGSVCLYDVSTLCRLPIETSGINVKDASALAANKIPAKAMYKVQQLGASLRLDVNIDIYHDSEIQPTARYDQHPPSYHVHQRTDLGRFSPLPCPWSLGRNASPSWLCACRTFDDLTWATKSMLGCSRSWSHTAAGMVSRTT